MQTLKDIQFLDFITTGITFFLLFNKEVLKSQVALIFLKKDVLNSTAAFPKICIKARNVSARAAKAEINSTQ